MTATPSDSRSASPLEHDPSASKSLRHADTSPSSTSDPVAQVPDVTRAFIHATAALSQTPDPHPFRQSSGVQSPYPRKAAV